VPYTTKEKVREVLARTSVSLPGTAGSLSDATIEDAIAEAQSEIDSRLGILYTVPFVDPNVPALIQTMATAISAYRADLTFREVRDYSSELNPVYLRYRDAIELLDRIGAGKATLPGYVPPEPDPGPDDAPGGDVGEPINPCLESLTGRTHPEWMDVYYGWTL
jgi:phage gp36-like protein